MKRQGQPCSMVTFVDSILSVGVGIHEEGNTTTANEIGDQSHKHSNNLDSKSIKTVSYNPAIATSFHVSISRHFHLRHHQIQSFIDKLGFALSTVFSSRYRFCCCNLRII